jgi:hypothetical protein
MFVVVSDGDDLLVFGGIGSVALSCEFSWMIFVDDQEMV